MTDSDRIIPDKSSCLYASCYCEENVYKLVQNISHQCPDKLSLVSAVFISNSSQCVPLWYAREKFWFISIFTQKWVRAASESSHLKHSQCSDNSFFLRKSIFVFWGAPENFVEPLKPYFAPPTFSFGWRGVGGGYISKILFFDLSIWIIAALVLFWTWILYLTSTMD